MMWVLLHWCKIAREGLKKYYAPLTGGWFHFLSRKVMPDDWEIQVCCEMSATRCRVPLKSWQLSLTEESACHPPAMLNNHCPLSQIKLEESCRLKKAFFIFSLASSLLPI